MYDVKVYMGEVDNYEIIEFVSETDAWSVTKNGERLIFSKLDGEETFRAIRVLRISVNRI